MPFLDPTAQYDDEVKSYKPALEKFSMLLETDTLGRLPVPREVPGPIRSALVSRALRDDGAEVLGQVKGHAIYLLKGDPFQEPELRYNFNLVLLMDVFGFDEEESDRYEAELDEILW